MICWLPPHPLLQCQNINSLRKPQQDIACILNTWPGYSGDSPSPLPTFYSKNSTGKVLCLFLLVFFCSFDPLLFGYSGHSVLFLFLHKPIISFGISGLDVFGPHSPKRSFGAVSVVSSAENGCVPPHLSDLGTAFSSVAKEQVM